MDARDNYHSLILTIRDRFDAIQSLEALSASFPQAEAAVFHSRKIVEAIAFGCLVAIENSLNHIPRDAKGRWNAEEIFKSLKSKNLTILPSPSRLRAATLQEQQENNAKVTMEGIPERRLSHDDLIGIYRALWGDLERLRLFVERHFISIQGEAFYCTLWDSKDKKTKVISLTKNTA